VKKFIGDISRQDATVLERYAAASSSVLEFGVGASTQVIAQSVRPGTPFISLDTKQEWIDKTLVFLKRLGVEGRCRMMAYAEWNWAVDKLCFDLVFNDGSDSLRREFGLRSFPLLQPGGVMLFHDTRRTEDVRNVLAVVETFHEEVEHVHLNKRIDEVSSNITVIKKKIREPYVNWNAVERRQSWAVGYGTVPEDFWGH
jgi:predicted O-methyltransferase YrrM